ncbi:ORF120 [Saltwater crocodilepox virus]|nr:hypothetical protein [Saltwater crocodilepox virus]AVD69455.1 hypothetical protein [Saltwater crocodilepox virus]QGT46558.1 ORF120 [Saltwater crocodilepox virus]QGT46774.1 ORF120 [Saltwater crocodilepox virus]QGT46990.1 ORF120 [Saltwater crocodilepox virus]
MNDFTPCRFCDNIERGTLCFLNVRFYTLRSLLRDVPCAPGDYVLIPTPQEVCDLLSRSDPRFASMLLLSSSVYRDLRYVPRRRSLCRFTIPDKTVLF